eukprot:CAMPEP_0114656336 /NCGR_PEP_ID=MMETSP0191-20121206/12181_1 /TAXON_ID=126664 /ORGANISM="Sorites sp." /LENGTH=328 /DNA_ID=CAMNT_0001873327 /DNA_START=209 /DNA_END=1195 /DNA_ORIENTATION=-
MSVPITEGSLSFDGIGKIYYRQARGVSDKTSILLLHSNKLTSSTWKGLGTIHNFGYYGFNTVAIDLPGFGKSMKAKAPSNDDDRSFLINSVISALKLKYVVIVCPQMSGEYCAPILMNANSNTEIITFNLVGMVFISPKGIGKYTKSEYSQLEIPTLNVYGERDNSDNKNTAMKMLEANELNIDVLIPDTGKAPYVENPKKFNEELMRFLRSRCDITELLDDDDKDEYEEVSSTDNNKPVGNNLFSNKLFSKMADTELDAFDKAEQEDSLRRDVTDMDDDTFDFDNLDDNDDSDTDGLLKDTIDDDDEDNDDNKSTNNDGGFLQKLWG